LAKEELEEHGSAIVEFLRQTGSEDGYQPSWTKKRAEVETAQQDQRHSEC
jgi:hypothetical protein